MKEGINLVPDPPDQKSSALNRLVGFGLEISPPVKTLKRINLALLPLWLLLLLLLLFAQVLTQRELVGRQDDQKKLLDLAGTKETVALILDRQETVKDLKTQKRDFDKLIRLIQEKVPQAVSLTNLNLTPEKIVIGAKTPTGLPFAQFVDSLVRRSEFKKVFLTTSAYDQTNDSFFFNLECWLI